jgi:hypothetical protein
MAKGFFALLGSVAKKPASKSSADVPAEVDSSDNSPINQDPSQGVVADPTASPGQQQQSNKVLAFILIAGVLMAGFLSFQPRSPMSNRVPAKQKANDQLDIVDFDAQPTLSPPPPPRQPQTQPQPKAVESVQPKPQTRQIAFPQPGTVHYFNDVNPVDFVSALQVVAANQYNLKYAVRFDRSDTGAPFMMLYLEPGQQVDMGIPVGTYMITIGAGNEWHGDTEFFGPQGQSFHLQANLVATKGGRALINVAPMVNRP